MKDVNAAQQYAPQVARYFDRPLLAMGRDLQGAAGAIEQGLHIRFGADVQNEKLAKVGFRAFACPHIIAACNRVAEQLEVFTLGTRLTRATPALRHANPTRALERASALIADIDGGTRIGEALTAFLAVPRYAGFTRGAAVVVLSDGLEIGAPDALISAARRLERLAWRLDWLSPLTPDGVPQTQAMQAILPYLTRLGDGTSTQAIVDHLLTMAEAA